MNAIEKLLQPSSSSSKPSGPLIQDLDGSPIESLDAPPPVKENPGSSILPSRHINDDEPSMLELMMAAQKEAAQENKQKKEAETKAKEPSFGSGLKKGFFGNSKPATSKSTTTKVEPVSKKSTNEVASTPSSTQKTDFDDDIIDLTNVSGKKSKGPVNLNMNGKTANKDSSDKYVFEDVQKAMDEDQHPLLQQVKKNEWVTPDLMSIMQSNKIVSKGLKDPKCTAALQLMQTNPKEAMARFKDDEDVSIFLREFGAVMAAHFEGLAAQQQQQEQPPPAPQQASKISEVSPTGNKIQEVGVLQAQALQRQKEAQETSKKQEAVVGDKSVVKSSTGSAATKKETEEEKVQRILQDEELRTLLMDVEFQKLLVECNDPIKFQQHMRNPETARKIKKLHESGLVQTQR